MCYHHKLFVCISSSLHSQGRNKAGLSMWENWSWKSLTYADQDNAKKGNLMKTSNVMLYSGSIQQGCKFLLKLFDASWFTNPALKNILCFY